MEQVKTMTATLVRQFGKGKAWDRAGLYWLNPPMPQVLRDRTYEYHEYVLVTVRGDTADMYASDKDGKLTGKFARWTPLTRDDGEARGLFMMDDLTCAGALEAEGYTITDWGGTR